MPWIIAAIAAALVLSKRLPPPSSPAPAGAVAQVNQAAVQAQVTSTLGVIQANQPDAPNVYGQQAEKVGASAATGLLATGANAALTTGASVGAALSTGLLTAGIGAAAFFGVEAVSDLFKCGTIGQTGCNKRSDAQLQIIGIEAMRRAMYAVETGQATVAQAAQQIQSIANQVQANYKNKASGNHFTIYVDGSLSSIPEASLSGMYMDGQQSSLSAMTAAFIGYLPTLAAAQKAAA